MTFADQIRRAQEERRAKQRAEQPARSEAPEYDRNEQRPNSVVSVVRSYIAPPRLSAVALHGVAGEIVERVAPHTEADPVGILLQLLVAFGNAIGRNPYFQVDADRHYPVEFALLVGPTASVRKGNGFANRFLIACVSRSRLLPDGGGFADLDLSRLISWFRSAVMAARRIAQMVRDDQARARWHEVYGHLSAGSPGLVGEVLSRATAHVVRLSMLYALLAQSAEIRLPHLRAALALWEYCQQSAAAIFGDSTGDRNADSLLKELRQRPAGMSRTDIRDLFHKNVSAARVEQILVVLEENGLALQQPPESNGRGRREERWFAAQKTYDHTTETTKVSSSDQAATPHEPEEEGEV